jgi:diguanylate cyclase (GGDEF)-like protein
MKILLVEDNTLTVELLVTILADQHYTVDVATDGLAGLELVYSFAYDLILLDVMLPNLDGITFCQRLRSQGNQIPILLLTAQDTVTNRVIGLDAGADDYLAKPFDLQELLARIRALLRRGISTLPPILLWRQLKLDPSICEVSWNQVPLRLTPKEYTLLELFLRNPNRIYSCSALIDQLWSFEEPPTEDTVRSHLKGLRMKLRTAGVPEDPIETVYGIGYRLKPDRKEDGETKEKLKNSKLSSHESKSELNAGTINEIWERAKENIPERFAVIDSAIAGLRSGKLGKKLRARAEQEAHKLAGSLGMFGSDRGSHLAREIELQFQAGVKLNQDQAQHIELLFVALRHEMEHINPGAIPELMSIQKPAESQENHTSKEAVVMVVDDDTLVLNALKSLLEPWGMKVVTLNNPHRFWDVLVDKQPELLILDVEMAEVSGIDLCEELRNNPDWSGLPILFLTARTDVETMHQVFAVGADDYVSKPIVGPELVTRIHNRLERSRLLRSLAEIDALTGIANRRKSSQELSKLTLANQPFCFAVVTLDHLKRINRQYGHEKGDGVLSRLAELLQRTLCSEDVLGRWGGKEFVIGMPGISKTEAVGRLAEVLKNFSQLEFSSTDNIQFQATFRAGVAQYPEDGGDLQKLYQVADALLEQGKQAGRNQVLG